MLSGDRSSQETRKSNKVRRTFTTWYNDDDATVVPLDLVMEKSLDRTIIRRSYPKFASNLTFFYVHFN